MLVPLLLGIAVLIVGEWSSLVALNTRRETMKAWSVIGLLFAAAIFATIPISAQVTPRGVELSVDGAKAITYGHARRVQRRVGRREYRQERRAVRRGY
jgi:hypothetical protein